MHDKPHSVYVDSPRKPYTAPYLILYGDIREITQGTGSVGKLDNPPLPVKSGGV